MRGRPVARAVALTLAALPLAALAPSQPALHPGVQLMGEVRIPADARDLSGLADTAGGVPHDRFGSWGSAIEWTGRGSIFLVAADRGPLDGATAFRTRWHEVFLKYPGETFSDDDKVLEPAEFDKAVLEMEARHKDLLSQGIQACFGAPQASPDRGIWRVRSTTLLRDERGRPLVGSVDAIDPADAANDTRLDPEAIRLGPDGTVYVADEYGPHVLAFNGSGTLVRRLPLPARFAAERRSASPDDELPPASTRGRQPNRGFESLAIAGDGAALYAMPQSPLIQDGAGAWEEMDGQRRWDRQGANVRILEIPLRPRADGTPEPTREYLYKLQSPSHGVSELLAIDDGQPGVRRFLAVERDGKPGAEARYKRIMLVEIGGMDGRMGAMWRASDISAIDALPARGVPAGVVPARTQPLIDLLDPAFALAGPDFPEKIEGLAWGPDAPDGRKVLVVASDNDLRDGQPTRVWFFAIERSALGLAPRPAAGAPPAGDPAAPAAQ